MKIVLLGYMASGKTITAKKLHQITNLAHIDLDAYIEEKENMSVSEIFIEKGEIAFRLLENRYLKELLLSKKTFILSVGGGTPCYANNMLLITENSKSIYLKASIDTIYQRLLNGKDKRPLVKEISNEHLKEFIAKHLFERNIYYTKASKHVSVQDKTVVQIANEIVDFLSR